MAPTFAADPRVRLVAAADPRPEARQQFGRDFSGSGCAAIDELIADPGSTSSISRHRISSMRGRRVWPRAGASMSWLRNRWLSACANVAP
jgi:hypothetical protein